MLEHINGEAGVALQAGGADVLNSARRAGDSGDCERIGSRGGIGLDGVRRWVDVRALGDYESSLTR